MSDVKNSRHELFGESEFDFWISESVKDKLVEEDFDIDAELST